MPLRKTGHVDPLLSDGLKRLLAQAESPANLEPQASEQPAQPERPKQYAVPNQKMGWLQKRVEVLNKAIASINARGAAFGAEPLRPIAVRILGDAQIPTGKEGVSIPAKTVEVDGDTPAIRGWEFVATLVPMTDDAGRQMNLIKAVPGSSPVPEEYRTQVPKCDYCKQPRRRNETFLLKKGGEYAQIGRNCLAKFLNTSGPEAVADLASSISDLFASLEAMGGTDYWEGGEEGGGAREKAVSIGMFVSTAIAVMRAVGWTPRSRSESSRHGATADIAWLWLTDKGDYRQRLQAKLDKPIEARDEDRDLAEKAILWARELKKQAPETLTDYLWNLSAASSQAVVMEKTAGIVASVVNAYQRANAAVDASGAGKPVFFRGKVTGKKPTKTGSTMWEFESERGEKAVWFDNRHEMDEALDGAMASGAAVQFEGMLQKVGSYMGQQQMQVVLKRMLTDQEFFEGSKKAEEAAQQAEQAKASAPPLAPGLKAKMRLTVVGVKAFEGYQPGSVTTLYKLVDEYGRRFFWKTSAQLELKEGSTYDCNVVVGWDKVPGSNKPNLDAQGRKQLGHDKYDPSSVKLDKVDPVAIEGKALVTKQDVAAKAKLVDGLRARMDAAQEAMAQAAHGVRQAERIAGRDEAPAVLARLGEEVARAKSSPGAEFKPGKIGGNADYMLARSQERQSSPEEVVAAIGQEAAKGLAAQARLREIAPEIQALIAEWKGSGKNGWDQELIQRAQDIGKRMSEAAKGSPLEIQGYFRDMYDFERFSVSSGLSDALEGDGKSYWLRQYEKDAREAIQNPELRAKYRPPGNYSSIPNPFTSERFVQEAEAMAKEMQDGLAALPGLLAQEAEAGKAHVAAKAAWDAAASELEALQEQRERGQAKTSAWIGSTCRFAVNWDVRRDRTEAFRAGISAYRAGKPPEANPGGQFAESWENGWRKAAGLPPRSQFRKREPPAGGTGLQSLT